MIEITEVPYDDAVAVALVAALHTDIEHRYAYAMVDMTPDQHEEDHAGYLAEISPDLVAHPHGTFVVAWLDGEPAGCGALKPLDAGSGVAEVKRMYTAPVARRRGVSRAVLSRLEAVAAALGYRTLQLETGTAQPEALALYASHGWHRIALYGRYQDDPDSVCFAKDLRPA